MECERSVECEDLRSVRSEECGDLWRLNICGVWRSVESEECGDLWSVEI